MISVSVASAIVAAGCNPALAVDQSDLLDAESPNSVDTTCMMPNSVRACTKPTRIVRASAADAVLGLASEALAARDPQPSVSAAGTALTIVRVH